MFYLTSIVLNISIRRPLPSVRRHRELVSPTRPSVERKMLSSLTGYTMRHTEIHRLSIERPQLSTSVSWQISHGSLFVDIERLAALLVYLSVDQNRFSALNNEQVRESHRASSSVNRTAATEYVCPVRRQICLCCLSVDIERLSYLSVRERGFQPSTI